MRKISDCLTEVDTAYFGHDVSSGEGSNAGRCRSSCKSKGADYFTFIVADKLCECKNSAAGRRKQAGRISGETPCTGEMNFLKHILVDKCEIAPADHGY